ncbi:hypothetical protein [Maribacter sp. 2307ULW6-5]|uniref:hypothetical protein n=1 Tax=Maribacter sp. 2307ULW6-5 TaxID=3386275 RepID=UPI0039BCEA31
MKTAHSTVFNLIEIFRQPRFRNPKKTLRETDCDLHQHHDYYCDAEKQLANTQNSR